jgi:uncharacterized protein involved in exopolysaccharide biosynthesis
VWKLLRTKAAVWLFPAVLIAVAVGVYAAFHQETWEASQALVVRNEAFGAERGPGKFSYPEEMKTVQETILEVVRSRSVLEAALREVGPAKEDHPARRSPPPPRDGGECRSAFPSDRDVAELRKNVKLAPPKGAEFGKTEVFYLTVRAENHARSVALNEAIFKQLRARFQALRDAKAESMVEELTKTVRLAKADLDRATAALETVERRVGPDLGELRSLQDLATSDSALRRSGEEIRAQLRENATAEKMNRELLAAVADSLADPRRFAALPNRLLESHASLRRLKDGLVDAQLRTAALLGTMSAEHPRVQTAKETEAEIGRNLGNELIAAQRGIEIELQLCAQRRTLLEEQLAGGNRRLAALAELRAGYTNLVAEAGSRSGLLEKAEANLAEARAARASAKATSLISRIDAPDSGTGPVGPGRIVIALGGVAAGLLIGLGILFLVAPAAAPLAAPVAANGHGSVRHALGKLAASRN